MDQPIIVYNNFKNVFIKYEGEFEVQDNIVLFEGGATAWFITPEYYKTGIPLEDIEYVRDCFKEPDVLENSMILFSTGHTGKLKLSDELKNYLDENQLNYFVGRTRTIIELYKELCKKKRVIAFINSKIL